MDFKKYHKRAQHRLIDDFTLGETIVSYLITGWFNGKIFQAGEGGIHIGKEEEPTLQELCDSVDLCEKERVDAHERMLNRGLLEKKYVAGQLCKWAPTQDFFRVVETIYSDAESLYPGWVDAQEHSGPPTYRDGNELLEHRKGAIALDYALGPIEQITYTELYPRLRIEERPDLWFYKHGSPCAWGEITGSHNNRQSWERKYEAWSNSEALPTMWIFPNRKTMVEFWNYLIREDYIELDNGMFTGEPNNWSPTRVNDRLQRSRTGRYDYNSHDCCWTIRGLIEADTIDVFTWLDDYDII